MAQTMVNFRIDEEVKRKMGSACKEMGSSLSTAFDIFAIKVGNERRIPFEVAADPFLRSNEPSSRACTDIWRMPRGSDTPQLSLRCRFDAP